MIVRKLFIGFGKNNFVSPGVRKPGNICYNCITYCHAKTLAVKIVLNYLANKKTNKVMAAIRSMRLKTSDVNPPKYV